MYDIIRVDAIDLTLQSRKLPGQFFTYWGMLFISGFIIGSPLFFYQIWAFIAPALEKQERWKTILTAFFITFFFGVGIEVENPWNIVFLCCPLLLVVCTIGP